MELYNEIDTLKSYLESLVLIPIPNADYINLKKSIDEQDIVLFEKTIKNSNGEIYSELISDALILIILERKKVCIFIMNFLNIMLTFSEIEGSIYSNTIKEIINSVRKFT